MLTRFRIEVEGADSAAACEEELAKYEHALQVAEAERYGARCDRKAHACEDPEGVRDALVEAAPEASPAQLATAVRRLLQADGRPIALPWRHAVAARDYFNEILGREVTDEVIEYDSGLPGYKGRRVVQFKRVDTRSRTAQYAEGGEW